MLCLPGWKRVGFVRAAEHESPPQTRRKPKATPRTIKASANSLSALPIDTAGHSDSLATHTLARDENWHFDRHQVAGRSTRLPRAVSFYHPENK
jgi:hypothetical protein